MHFSAVLLYGLQFAVLTVAVFAGCSHDNCLRAVIASAFPTRHGSADCASYFKATVTLPALTVTQPAPTTVTTTLTITIPTGGAKRDVAPDIVARQVTVTPSSIPAYASACSGSLGYSSACSCVGATPTTTTVGLTTSTVFYTSTVSVCENPLPTFILQITNSGVVYNGIPLDGTYGNYDDGDGPLVGFNGDGKSDAVTLSITPACNLEIDFLKVLGNTNGPPGRPKLMHFDSPPINYAVPVTCSVVNGKLSCRNDGCDPNGNNGCQTGVDILQICPSYAVTNDLWIGAEIGVNCSSATFNVIPV